MPNFLINPDIGMLSGPLLSNPETNTKAAALLGERLAAYRQTQALLVGVTRHSLALACELQEHLLLPLIPVLCRSIRHPADQQRTIGSVSVDDALLHDDEPGIPQHYIYHQVTMIRSALGAQQRLYHPQPASPNIFTGRTVIVVDDRLAHADHLLASLMTIRKQQPEKIILAVHEITNDAFDRLASVVEVVMALIKTPVLPQSPRTELSDDQVINMLHASAGAHTGQGGRT